MKKNILLLVTGMTPQIITETVWALACDPENQDKWIPDEIHVVSTTDGLTQIKSRLFADGIFDTFQQEYPELSHIKFVDSHLHIIKNAELQALSDLKTPEDNECAANAICEKVRQFTADEQITLHVSIAGGRKTMGFYAGYALSLYGRAQDRMSHVLVSSEYETLRGFYYPSKQPETTIIKTFIKKIQNNTEILEERELDAFKAKVWLANIPFVRLRTSLPEESLIKKANFSDVVNAINMASQPIKLILDVKTQKVCIANKECQLSSREFAFYYWFAKHKVDKKMAILAPEKGIVASSANKFNYPQMCDLSEDYLSFYKPLKGFMGNDTVEETLKFGMERTFFDERKAAVLKAFKKTFGLDLANKIEIKNISRLQGTKGLTKLEKIALQGKYMLAIDCSSIEIIQ